VRNTVCGSAPSKVAEPTEKARLELFEEALNNAKPIQFKENIALVLKYYDKLPPLRSNEREVLCALHVRFSCGP
jgi:ribosomal protein S7